MGKKTSRKLTAWFVALSLILTVGSVLWNYVHWIVSLIGMGVLLFAAIYLKIGDL